MNALQAWAQEERGRVTRLAKHLGRSVPYTQKMVVGSKPVPVKYGPLIESFSGVSRKELFPDDWQSIWPELATTNKKREASS